MNIFVFAAYGVTGFLMVSAAILAWRWSQYKGQ